ncbi:MAG: DNA methyltransferase [bacterium]
MKQIEIFEFINKPVENLETLEKLPFKRVRKETLDFKDIPASTDVYGIHPYPAMFHFLLVRKLIQDFSNKYDLVMDPFMGSGVVAIESIINNRNFIGYDINPLAILIAKVRATSIPQEKLLKTLNTIEKTYNNVTIESIDFHNIHYWFEEYVIDQLSKLRKAIFSIEDDEVKNFYKVVFSETVRRASKTKYNEFKLLRKKNEENNVNVLKIFREISLKNIGLLTSFYKNNSVRETKMVLEIKNILEDTEQKSEYIDLVVTSPPYGDSKTTVAYGQFSRLSLRWLGIEENVDRLSLGNRQKEICFNLPSQILYDVLKKVANKDEKRSKEVFSFYKDLFDSIQIIARKVKKNGFVCFVVGNRKVKGEELPTDKISVDFFQSFGLSHLETMVRAISNKRMPIKNAPSNIRGEKDYTMKYEYIVILKK